MVDTRKQVWAGAIGSGSDGTKLQATWRQTNKLEFQDSMGNSIVEVCKIVPHGVLMFLPSYSMLDKLTARWKVSKAAHVAEKDAANCKTPLCCELLFTSGPGRASSLVL